MTAFADKDPALPRCISQQTESAFSSVQRLQLEGGLRLTHAGVLPGLWTGFQEAGSSPRAASVPRDPQQTSESLLSTYYMPNSGVPGNSEIYMM